MAVAVVVVFAVSACERSTEDRLVEIRELQRSGKIGESIPLLIELIESGAEGGEVYYRYGRALAATGHPERSVWALDAAMEDPKWLVFAGQQLAIEAHRSENLELGLEILDRLERERPDGEEVALPERLLKARMLVQTNRRYEEAIAVLDEILSENPDEEEALRLKAAALLGLSRPDEAYEVIRRARQEPGPAKSKGEDPAGIAAVEGSDAEREDGAVAAVDEVDEVDEAVRDQYWCAIRASFQRESRKPDKAAEIVDECLERHPDSIALINEATKIFAERRPDHILEILQSANEANPEDPDIRQALVRSLSSVGRFDDAEAVLRKRVEAARADSESPGEKVALLLSDLAGFLIGRGRTDDALTAFGEVREILGDAMSPDLQIRYADTLIDAGRYDEALVIAERTPVEIHQSMIRGRVAFERGSYAEALELLDEAALHWPDNAPIHYYLARTAEGLGDFDRAVEDYRQVVRSDASLTAARSRLVQLHLAEGKPREAAVILGFVDTKSGGAAPAMELRILGIEVSARLGRELRLEVYADPGTDLESAFLDSVRALGRGLEARLGAADAETTMEKFQATATAENRGFFLRERVRLLLGSGDVERAIAIATKASESSADDLHVRFALGRALSMSEARRDEGEAILRGVLEKRPMDVEVRVAIGQVEAARGSSAAAIRSAETALEISPADWPAMKLLADQLLRIGRREQAVGKLVGFLDRAAPYCGEAALALAELKVGDGAPTSESVPLTLRAIRFGAGSAATELLARLDPEAASRLSGKVEHSPAKPPAASDEQPKTAKPKPASPAARS